MRLGSRVLIPAEERGVDIGIELEFRDRSLSLAEVEFRFWFKADLDSACRTAAFSSQQPLWPWCSPSSAQDLARGGAAFWTSFDVMIPAVVMFNVILG